MRFDFEKIEREQEGRFGLGRTSPFILDDSFGPLDVAGDVLAAPFRGIEGALRDTYSLADTVSFDLLPDLPDKPLLGDSKTIPGELVQGISNFVVGFIPALKVVKAAKFTKGLGKIGQAAAAGAITDFTVFDGHEGRLSTLIQSFPGLQNPITDFLQNREDDSEIGGRLKGAIEGLGIGGVIDGIGLLSGLRKVKAGRKARDAGGSPEDVQKAVDGVEGLRVVRKTDAVPNGEGIDISTKRFVVNEKDEVVEELAFEPPPLGDPIAKSLDDSALESTAKPTQRQPEAITVTKEDLDVFEERAKPDDTLVLKENGAVNLKVFLANIASRDDGHLELVRYMEEINSKQRARWGAGESIEKAMLRSRNRLADMLGDGDIHTVLDAGSKAPNIIKSQADIVQAQGDAMAVLMDEIVRRQKLAQSLDAPPLDHVEIMALHETLAELASNSLSGGTAISHALGNRRGAKDLLKLKSLSPLITDAAVRKSFDDSITDLVTSAGGRKRLRKHHKKILAAFGTGDMEGLAAAIKMVRSPSHSIFDMTNEYWMNSILSGPKTQAVNVLSGLFASIYRPLELSAGAAWSELLKEGKGDYSLANQYLSELGELFSAFMDGAQYGKEAYKNGQGILKSGTGKAEIHETSLVFSGETGASKMANWVSQHIVRAPTRFLTGVDEVVSQMNARAVGQAHFARQAAEAGKTGIEAAKHVSDGMDKLIHKGQAFSSQAVLRRGLDIARETMPEGTSLEALEQNALRYLHDTWETGGGKDLQALSDVAVTRATESTFTSPLTDDRVLSKLGSHAQAAIADLPVLRFVAPFIRTPTNLIQWALDRTVVAPFAALDAIRIKKFQKSSEDAWTAITKDFLSDDAARQADAHGRLASASAAMVAAITLPASGIISGAGPSNPAERKILEQQGWLPYSIKTPDGWVSYRRFDPFASVLGTIADIGDYMRYTDSLEEKDSVATLGKAIFGALAHNFTKKSYLTGFQNFIQLMSDPSRFSENFIARTGAGFVPSFLAQGRFAAGDDHIRDVNGILDAFKARIPGLSTTLPPMRNILGEPIKPVTAAGAETIGRAMDFWLPVQYSKTSDDIVTNELAQMRHGFSPPRKDYHGHDLLSFENRAGQNSYDRWSELHGTVRLRGKTLRQTLRKLFKDPKYQKLPDRGTDSLDSPRITKVRRVISRYRRLAMKQLLREYPDLARAEVLRSQNRTALNRGTSPLDLLNR